MAHSLKSVHSDDLLFVCRLQADAAVSRSSPQNRPLTAGISSCHHVLFIRAEFSCGVIGEEYRAPTHVAERLSRFCFTLARRLPARGTSPYRQRADSPDPGLFSKPNPSNRYLAMVVSCLRAICQGEKFCSDAFLSPHSAYATLWLWVSFCHIEPLGCITLPRSSKLGT